MIRIIIFISLSLQFFYSKDKGLSSFEKENYKESFEYYLNVLDSRENDISAKFGAGISAFKNQNIETGMKYLQEVSNAEDEILSSRAHFNLATIFKDENKLEESLYHYKKAIELNSKDRDSRINYELLKKMLSQEDQGSQSNPGDEGDKSQEDQGSQSNSGDEGDKSQEDQGSQSNPGDEGDKSQEDQVSQSNPGDEGDKSQEDQGSQN
jgi:Cobalamin biosynthesis protein CobT (nicotinate-mononucleotide:5, 6-dimethylbenzimidazole phosphoribosyltransferase)